MNNAPNLETGSKPQQYCAVDVTHTEIKLTQLAKRIVCLTATGLDILVELGLEPVGYLSQGIASRPEFYGESSQQFMSVGSWMMPNFSAIQNTQPDLIIGWVFPHRFYRWWWRNTAPIYLMGGSGFDATLRRLRDIAQLTGRMAEAEAAIMRIEAKIQAYRLAIPEHERKIVLMMGGSTLNCLSQKFIIETDAGTFGSVIKQLAQYPWSEPMTKNHEPGFTSLSLKEILQVNPDIIFVQTYPPSPVPLSQQLAKNPLWRQLKSVQNHQVYEVDQFWHSGNGTRMLGLILDQLMPMVYPQLILS
ncbi:ABC transporter substrate-binding protein [Nostoc sp. UHCC 0870]|uniref:ABC transporter substrate-binding protein n=1 Tax=Nostoc sp. UHCC 0870 TaxID=2914041 RepID=UPI001EDDD1AB|nr:ABC transporter substrate-binding protein [Nostoc sp. UHCC 0870]UKO96874.1 ABC transporter substrate-binding protein [Nostoc sp. UHCC 0870]